MSTDFGSMTHDVSSLVGGVQSPYEFGSSSDGFFNLGCALSYVQTLQSGVYITMQGQYFKWDKVIKNSKKGFFEKLYIIQITLSIYFKIFSFSVEDFSKICLAFFKIP